VKRISFSLLLIILMNITVFAQFPGMPGQRPPRSGISEQRTDQTFILSGKVIDKVDDIPMAGAHVKVSHSRDTTRVFQAATDLMGAFSIMVPRGIYKIEISFLGYEKIEKEVRVLQQSLDMGPLGMSMNRAMLDEVTVTAQTIPVQQKGDTLQFNALAFKVNPDANAEDLIRRMPGFTLGPDGLHVQGEAVTRVLVDGQRFFGDDPNIALRNLPAEMIESIEVFDELSDRAQLTGFDDGQTTKTVNIVTRLDRRSGQFGRVYSGYGDTERYQAGLTTNIFRNQTRMSVIGMSNNINQQNFSMDDMSGFMNTGGRGGFSGGMRGMRGGGGGGMSRGGGSFSRGDFMVGQQSGNNTTSSIGINYTDIWAGSVNVNGSYFLNHSKNDSERFSDRQYFIEENVSQFHNDTTLSNMENMNHRFNARIEYDINEQHSLIFSPRFNIQQTTSGNFTDALTRLPDNQLLNQSHSGSTREWGGYTLSTGIMHRARLGKPRRSVSTDLNINMNNNEYLNFLDALSNYYEGPVFVEDLLRQRSDSNTETMGINTGITYTEPVGQRSMLQFSYNFSFSNNMTDRLTNSWDIIRESYTIFENDRSSELTNGYLTHRAGFSYRFNAEKYRFNLELQYQDAGLSTDQIIPYELDINKNFRTLLPSASFNYNFSRTHSLRFQYSSSTNAPSVNQLQDMVDNTNPLQLSSGNPDLKQSFSHFVNLRYNLTSLEKSRTLMLFASASLTNDFVTTSTFIAPRDTILSIGRNEVFLPRGAQYSRPVNESGFANVRSWMSYSFVLKPIKSNISLNTGLSYTHSPGMINNQSNISNNWGYSGGVNLSSNISENIDFMLSYSANYNTADNSLQPTLNNSYFYHIAGARFTWLFLDGRWVIRSDANNMIYTGMGDDYNENYWLWNINLGRKFLANKQAELTLGVYDLLNQNSSVSRVIANNYIEDVRSNVLNRFFMLTFTYNIRHFNLG
jgi:hypothetical protein